MKPNFILDLDQTLISAEEVDSLDKDVKVHKNGRKVNKHSSFTYKSIADIYVAFYRPNLQDFLTFLFENFNVSVWTAGTKDYCLDIVEKIIIGKHKHRKLDFIMFRNHLNKKDPIKPLSEFWETYKVNGYTEQNTIILDDNKESVYTHQETNCINCPEFQYTDDTSHEDDFLLFLTKQLTSLLKKYNKTNDVRDSVEKINEIIKSKYSI